MAYMRFTGQSGQRTGQNWSRVIPNRGNETMRQKFWILFAWLACAAASLSAAGFVRAAELAERVLSKSNR